MFKLFSSESRVKNFFHLSNSIVYSRDVKEHASNKACLKFSVWSQQKFL